MTSTCVEKQITLITMMGSPCLRERLRLRRGLSFMGLGLEQDHEEKAMQEKEGHELGEL